MWHLPHHSLLALHDSNVLDKRNLLEAVENLELENACVRLPSSSSLDEEVVGGNENAMAGSICEVELVGRAVVLEQPGACGSESVSNLRLHVEQVDGVGETSHGRSDAGGSRASGEPHAASGGSGIVLVDLREVAPNLQQLHDDGISACLWPHSNNGSSKSDFSDSVSSRKSDRTRKSLRVDIVSSTSELIPI